MLQNLAIVLAILFLSNLVQATFSFGGALVALPLLALVLDVRAATPLMTLLSLSIACVVAIRNRREIQAGSAWRLVLSACLGIPLGITFLTRFDERLLKAGLALTVLVFTVAGLISFRGFRLKNPNLAFPFGFTSGVFGGAYNISGPPVVLYGTLAGWTSGQFRATIQAYSLLTNAFALLGYGIAGHLTREVLAYWACALPIVAVTVWLGNRIHHAIRSDRYVMVVKVLLLVLGARLLCAALA